MSATRTVRYRAARITAALLSVLAVLLALQTATEAQTPGEPATCDGLTVTVNIGAGQSPTPGDDVIMGTAGNDTIFAGDGNDVICGEGGNDTIFGQNGNDRAFGGAGNDQLSGNAGNDQLRGESGDDSVFGGSGNDLVSGGSGTDVLGGSSGSDTVRGGAGNDTMTGGSDADAEVSGGPGDDAVNGGGGNDSNVHGDDGNDTVSGNGGKDIVNGDNGNDEVRGGNGDDTVLGGSGDDFVAGNAGVDICNGGTGGEVLGDIAAPSCETQTNILPGVIRPALSVASAPPIPISITTSGQVVEILVGVSQEVIDRDGVLGASLDAVTEPMRNNGDFDIFDPDGALLTGTVLQDRSLVTGVLTKVGTYRIVIDPNSTDTGTATLRVWTPVDVTGTVVPGDSVADAGRVSFELPDPGQRAVFSVPISQSDVNQGRVLGAQLAGVTEPMRNNGDFDIFDPDGALLTGTVLQDRSLVTGVLTKVGTYTILVNPNFVDTGSATLRVWTPIDVTGTVTPGTTEANATPLAFDLVDPGQRGLFTVTVSQSDVNAGRTLSASLAGVTEPMRNNGDFDIFDPNGVRLTGTFIADRTVVTGALAEVGTYTILVDPNFADTGSATLRAWKAT